MEALTLDALDAQADAFDEEVLATSRIDHFCSSTAWVLPAHEALMPPREAWIRASEHGFAALARGTHESVGRYLQPLEASWCFASGLATRSPLNLVRDLHAALRDDPTGWDSLLLSGVALGSPLSQAILSVFGRRYQVWLGMTTTRHVALLHEGVDGFLARRSLNFRKGIRKDRRRAEGLELRFEPVEAPREAECAGLYGRMMSVEARSWKGQSGVGIGLGPMHRFYALMLPRLVRRGILRLSFARRDGVDVGYILGAVLGGLYRGLQFSFDDAYRGIGLGNLLQLHQMELLLGEGIGAYDLGSDAPYKERWSDSRVETVVLVVKR